MKRILMMMAGLLLVGCGEEKRADPALEAGREKILREAVRDRDKAESEARRLQEENYKLELEASKYKGREMIAVAERDAAQSRVENAFKLGRAQRMLEEARGK